LGSLQVPVGVQIAASGGTTRVSNPASRPSLLLDALALLPV
jgi:hypothetical protein